ncbi:MULTISPECIES: hypothetical protein [unclassified Marinobacter]|uniref:hypothetical protein n=1 Tax=unclassified Marinobacter TaxID=83889 RepID=UPI000BF2AC91|nr:MULTISPECIES: hypothetical protein [unclassified Marinobacter]PFG08861.1 hypothetical protein ATI45_1193 [Marinobacter sp. LV10MA510-1]PFG54727.1 hypothetical protein ATG98_4022 [Marinobacter sp. LV10R520-4]
MTAKQIFFGLLVAITGIGSASAWDFDRTRAADIMDRASNDGDQTAQLLLAFALDDRVQTIFDNYQFRLPVVTDESSLHVRYLHPEHLYENLMAGHGSASKESFMVYSVQGSFALDRKKYWMAANYYGMAASIGRKLLNGGMHPEISAVTQDAQAGKVAATVCNGDTPRQNSANKIASMLRRMPASDMAADYLSFIERKSYGSPSSFSMKGAGCFNAPLHNATVILPLAPYNYETNTRKATTVLR